MQLNITINQKLYTLECAADKRASEILRELGFISVKEGCKSGECGACTIYLNNKLVNACLLCALQIDNAQITTLEGLKKETLELKKSFIDEGAIQCGFCTPGFMMSGYDYLQNGGKADELQIKEALDGNLCRCSGYKKIIKAIKKVAK